MSTLNTYIESMTFNRSRTLGLLDRAVELSPTALGWRPAEGRAHVAWQLMHVGVTEELFGTERLRSGATPRFADVWERFRGGSTVDDNVPTTDQIRELLHGSRELLLTTLRTFDDSQMNDIVFPERDWTLATVLQVLCWHEAHHHGQAHITLNMAETKLKNLS